MSDTLTLTPPPDKWDAFVQSHPRGHALQLSAWGELKRAFGWGAERVALTDSTGQIMAGALILLKPLPFRLGAMGYIPFGPLVTDESHYTPLWAAIRQHLKPRRTAFLKIEPGIYHTELSPPGNTPDWSKWGFRESAQTVQPPNTILIDIGGEEAAILARMNQGTRRKIRAGEKNGVRYYAGDGGDVAKFTALMNATGERNVFGVHTPEYYQKAFDLFAPDHAALLLAEHEGETQAGVMVFAVGQTAWYLYGASSNEKRNLSAGYGVQWAAIQWARARGCTVYDLWGIPDADDAALEAEFQTRSDGLWHVYGMKRGWGGVVARSVGAWDSIYNPVIYAAYQAVLRWKSQ